jgi:hypothetical protein
MASMRELTSTAVACEQRGTPASSSEAIGRAVRAMIRLAGVSRTTAQVSSAEAIWAASASAPAVTLGPVPFPAGLAAFPAGLAAFPAGPSRRSGRPR